MPPVIRKPGREVTTARLPGARKTAAESPASLGSIGGDPIGEALASTGSAFARLGADRYARIKDEERRRADDVAILAAQNKLDAWELERLHNPQTGALNVRGQAAFTLPEEIDAEYDRVVGEIGQGLGTPEQRLAFEKLSSNRRGNVRLNIRRHVAGEMRAFEAGELKGTLENAVSLASANASDPRRVAEELSRGVAAIEGAGRRLGLGAEAVSSQIEAFRSGAHEGVIRNLLAGGRERAAQVYFEEVRGQIAGDRHDELLKALDEGTRTKAAQTAAEGILRQGGTLAEQRQRAKDTVTDGKTLDDVLSRLDHEATIREREERDTDERMMASAATLLDGGGRFDQIPAADRAKMTPAQRSGLRSYEKQIAEHGDAVTDLPTYYARMQQAMSDPDGFSRRNLLNDRHRLGKVEFKQLADLQLTIRNGERNRAAADLEPFATKTQVVNDTLTLYGIDPTAKPDTSEGRAIAQLRRLLDQRIEAAQTPDAQGRRAKVTNEEIRETLDGILAAEVTEPGSFWALIRPFTYDFADKRKRLIDLTPADVPAAERPAIERALRTRRMPVTDQTVLDLYIDSLIRRGAQ